MRALYAMAEQVDRFHRGVSRYALWLVLAATLISAGNALTRKLLNMSSNGWLEVQWYLFAASFMLAAAPTLLEDGHVRIDVLSSRFSHRTRTWIDLFGLLAFLAPVCGVMLWLSLPFFWQAWISGEHSSNAGGLPLWPVYALMPIGFTMLLLQGLSEVIKRIGALRGDLPHPSDRQQARTSDEEALAAELRQRLNAATSPTEAR